MSLQVGVSVMVTALDGTPFASFTHNVIVPYITPNTPQPTNLVEFTEAETLGRQHVATEMSLAANKAWDTLDEAKAAIHEQLNALTDGLLDVSE